MEDRPDEGLQTPGEQTPVGPSGDAFLGTLRSELDASSELHPAFVSLRKDYLDKRRAFDQGKVGREEYASVLLGLMLQGPDGDVWTLGATTGEWYRKDPTGQWRHAMPTVVTSGTYDRLPARTLPHLSLDVAATPRSSDTPDAEVPDAEALPAAAPEVAPEVAAAPEATDDVAAVDEVPQGAPAPARQDAGSPPPTSRGGLSEVAAAGGADETSTGDDAMDADDLQAMYDKSDEDAWLGGLKDLPGPADTGEREHPGAEHPPVDLPKLVPPGETVRSVDDRLAAEGVGLDDDELLELSGQLPSGSEQPADPADTTAPELSDPQRSGYGAEPEVPDPEPAPWLTPDDAPTSSGYGGLDDDPEPRETPGASDAPDVPEQDHTTSPAPWQTTPSGGYGDLDDEDDDVEGGVADAAAGSTSEDDDEDDWEFQLPPEALLDDDEDDV